MGEPYPLQREEQHYGASHNVVCTYDLFYSFGRLRVRIWDISEN